MASQHCPVCGENHEVVGHWGALPILHCPKVPPQERAILVSDTGRRTNAQHAAVP